MKASISIVLFTIIINLLIIGSIWSADSTITVAKFDPNDLKLIESINSFGCRLFVEINNANEPFDTSVCISPFSISTNLGPIYNGAAGKTLQTIREVLNLEDMDTDEFNQSYKKLIDNLDRRDTSVNFNISNSIWIPKGLSYKLQYIEKCQHNFKSEIKILDSSGESPETEINNWLSENAKDTIEQAVFPSLSDVNIIALVNSIYFEGEWKYKLEKNDQGMLDNFRFRDGSIGHFVNVK
ncbi:MAG: serpin family protein, partial [Candidatus Zixiibacteriota bacterium]